MRLDRIFTMNDIQVNPNLDTLKKSVPAIRKSYIIAKLLVRWLSSLTLKYSTNFENCEVMMIISLSGA